MSVIKCGACGKFYNDGQYNACPSCGVGPKSVEPQESEVTQTIIENTEINTEETSLGKYAQQNPEPPVPGIDFDDDTTVALDNSDEDEEVTVALVSKSTGIDPICGWLVCTEGPDQGRDFRIKSERNFVGRSPSMDIVISGDESISRENHASITFDPRTHSFTLNTGNGRGLVYLNQNVVDSPSTLNSYDLIELGETKLLFVPFAGDQFSWDK
jgi:predicted  nucleic acid-binding Zn-ribbon protein